MTAPTPVGLWDDGQLQRADIPLDQIESSIGEMATQLAAAGAFPVPVLRARYDVAVHLHGHAHVKAQETFEEWADAVAARDAADSAPIASAAAAMTGALPWCPHCDLADQAEHLALTGHHVEAVALAGRLLDAAPGSLCREQPAGVISAVLPSMLLGHEGPGPAAEQALRAATDHLLAVRLLELDDASARFTRARAWQLMVCARTGRLQQGLDLVQDWIDWAREATPPYARMQLAAAGARVLRDVSEAGAGEATIELVGGAGEDALDPAPVTVDELAARLLSEARDLAAAFDRRNHTQTATELLDDLLDAPDLPDLPLDAVLRSPRWAKVATRRPAIELQSRGRRAARAEDGEPSMSRDLGELVTQFDAALAADSSSGRAAVLTAWDSVRAVHELDIGEEGQDAARLDGWQAIEALHSAGEAAAARGDDLTGERAAAPAARRPDGTGLMDRVQAAARRLRMAGLPIEALLHEQAAELAAAQAGVVPLGEAAARIEAITTEIAELDSPADLGLAYSRLALVRELAAADPAAAAVEQSSERDSGLGADAQTDAVELGLRALEAVPVSGLRHQQARALCRLLRLHAGDESAQDAVSTLQRAVAVLPDGVRPVERALARTDLATLLQEADPQAALPVWQGAISDAALAGADGLLGTILSAGATVRLALGDARGAAADLVRAVPLLDESGPAELAAQARFDLARALIDAERYVEAASAAESALADLTDLMTQQLDEDEDGDELSTVEADQDGEAGALEDGGQAVISTDPGLAHIAGCAAFAAAEAVAALGDDVKARVLAELSAGWHEANGNLVAEAEAWQLAARIGGPARRVASDLERAAELAEAGGEWSRAASCRRDRATAVKEADGIEAALAVLDEADKVLSSREIPGGRHVSPDEAAATARLMTWHRLALSEQRARMLAVAGRFADALAAVDGLEAGYTSLGDDWSARDLLGLRGQLRAEVGNVPGGVDDLELAAAQAVAAGDRQQARGLGERLAMVLDQSGRPVEAEAAYRRYAG